MNWIINTYKFFGKIRIFRSIGQKFKSKKLLDAINFFNYYNDSQDFLTIEEVGAATVFTFLITFVISNIIFLIYNPLISLLISFIFSLIIARKLYYYLINSYEFQYLNSLQFLDLIYQDFLIIKNSTHSIFDAIEFIANSNYPIISKNFKNMIIRINSGELPEVALLRYVNSVSSYTFRERMINLLSYDMKTDKKVSRNEDFSLELTSKYQEYTKQLDTRMTILISVNIFLPILTITLFSFYLTINNYLIMILIPFHLLLLFILKKNLIKKEFFILGDESRTAKEFDELILLLSLFSNHLQMNNSPEISLLKSIMTYRGTIKNKLLEISKDLMLNNPTIDEIWNNLINILENSQSKVLLKLIRRMLKKSAYETGVRLKNIIDNINFNKKIIKKRQILLKSQQFKVIILLFILSGLMGLMTNIIPLFSQFFLVINSGIYPELFTLNNDLITLLPILITFSIILFFTSKTITNVIKFKKSLILSVLVLFIYFSIVYLTSMFFL
ncbi:MAG: hypothetical protein ACTSPY_06855 [Candidatus Helarchaeota archaeon]